MGVHAGGSIPIYRRQPVRLDISPEEAAAALLERRAMREHLAPFVKRAFGSIDPGAVYKHNWHIDLICEYLEACYHREILYLVINIAPRFLKSLCASVGFVAWALGKDPSERIISASGVSSLAIKHSMDTRKIMYETWYQSLFPDTRLSMHQDAKSRYETTRGGHRIALSVGGSSIGEGGRIKIIDDPIDPHKLSVAKIKEANYWYDNTWSTRSDDPARTVEIIIMQRLSVDDLTAHVMKQKKWEHLIIPQEPEKKTIIIFPRTKQKVTREPGELIHSERFGPTAVANAKATLGTYGYESQHNQKPTAKGGNRVKMDWFPRYRVMPVKFDEKVQSWDTANKPGEMNNPSVCETYGRIGGQWYLIDLFKEQLSYPDLKRKVKALYDRDRPDAVLIEDKASGQQLIQEYTDRSADIRLPVIAIEPDRDKAFRMEIQLPTLESKMVMLPSNEEMDVPWLFDLEVELTSFPMNLEWDSIDAMSQFLKWIKERGATHTPTAVPHSSTRSSMFRGNK